MKNPRKKYMNPFSGNLPAWVFRLLLTTIVIFTTVVLSAQQLVSLNDAVQQGLVNNYLIQVSKTKLKSRRGTSVMAMQDSCHR